MSRLDDVTADALRALSVHPGDNALSRRWFLGGAAAAAGAATVLPSWLHDAKAATLGAHEGVLVVVLMGGGNDGLNMVPPVEDGRYHDLRGTLAIGEGRALHVDAGVGLHPNLKRIHALGTKGHVAVVQGVGDPTPDLSHFTAMARWMTGQSAGGAPTAGWLGRWLDSSGRTDDLAAVSIGSNVPLSMVGTMRKATALPLAGGGGFARQEAWVRRATDCLREMGAGPTGSGSLADALGAAARSAVDLTALLAPVYAAELPGGKLTKQLELAARLVNADLGVRVIHVQFGDFDSHAGQSWMHDARMAELDEGVDRFFSLLAPRFAKRTALMTMSEFGRRPQVNGSGGTDHGTASNHLVIGANVVGGVYGEQMDLDQLDGGGNAAATVDFRSYFGTIASRWLGADTARLFGAPYEDLGFLRSPTR